MSKTKIQAQAPKKIPPPPTVQQQPEQPEKEGGPLPAARTADVMTSKGPGPGTADRARMMTGMQQAVGNTRLSRMLDTPVQAQPVEGGADNVDEQEAEQTAETVMQQTGLEQEAAMDETPAIQRKQAQGAAPKSGQTPARKGKRQDVVVIVGRPSRTLSINETPQEKEQMVAWRAAARALSSKVFEGLTVDRAFAGLKRLKGPIGKLYIIAHADVSGVGEVAPEGQSVSTTVEDLTQRMKKATGALGARKPLSVEMLSCFGGGSPKTMGRIGEALSAGKVRAPVQTTVISGRIININDRRLTARRARRLSDAQIEAYIQKTDALKYYDYVPGVPHPQTAPSKKQKLDALVGIVRRTGMVPFVSFNAEPGKRDAVPYWKVTITRKSKTEELSTGEQISSKGLIEVNLQEPKEQK
jgi:hypothetical protein